MLYVIMRIKLPSRFKGVSAMAKAHGSVAAVEVHATRGFFEDRHEANDALEFAVMALRDWYDIPPASAERVSDRAGTVVFVVPISKKRLTVKRKVR